MDNKKVHRRLTIEELRAHKGLENLTDEEAEKSIVALEKFSVILFEMWQQNLITKEAQKQANLE
jgi:hypothetical protein